MAKNKSPIIGNDPVITKNIERQLEQASLLARGTSTVLGNETIYPQSVAQVSGKSVSIVPTGESNDVVTVTTTSSIYVNSLDQTVNSYKVVNGVTQIIAGNNISISSTLANGTGIVTINGTIPSLGNISSINLDGNPTNVLHGDGTWSADITDYGNSNVASYLPTYTGNLSGNNLTLSGNVSALNLGNVISVNLDGNASNVLAGDGTWIAAGGGTYGDSNVTSLLGSFGSNTISTTGLITGDGGGLSNVPYANITGTPSLGNVSELNLDGNASNLLSGAGTYVAIPVVPTVGNIAALNLDGNVGNVLRGDGTWAADDAGTYGDSNVTSLLGAFGSNTIVTTGIITADGANLSNVPYSNLTGAPSLGNISSINLDGNSETWLAGNGVFANISIPTVGNIASINLDGNVGNVLRGDGTWAADDAGTYGDSNVTSLLGAFGSNTIVTTGIITADGANLSNVPYGNLTGAPTLGNISSINFDSNASNVLIGSGSFGAVPGLGNVGAVNFDSNASNVLLGSGSFGAVPVDSNTVIWTSVPGSNVATGTAGQAAYDSGGNLYVCVATDTWAKFTGTISW